MTRLRILAAAAIATAAILARPALAEDDFAAAIGALETRLDARIGVAVIDTASGEAWRHRAEERFLFNSTFKAYACGALLSEADAGRVDLSTRVRFEEDDLVPYSPDTESRTGGEGMSLGELCASTMTTSDNTAANLVLGAIGGPEGFTAFMRGLGDDISRLDASEPELNDGAPGDPRNTTTPDAAARSLRALALGDTLPEPSRETLVGWMRGNAVAGPLLRSILPEGWQIADRSGANGTNTRSIVAVVEPEGRAPAVVAIYLERTGSMAERNEAVVEAGRIVFDALSR